MYFFPTFGSYNKDLQKPRKRLKEFNSDNIAKIFQLLNNR